MAMPPKRVRESRMNPYQSPTSAQERRPFPRDLLLICASFVVLSGLGCTFIFTYWSRSGEFTTGVVRSAGFAAIMAAIHFAGYRLWKRQRPVAKSTDRDSEASTSIWSQKVPRGLFWLIVFSLLCFLILALRL